MAINKKLIHFNGKENFEDKVANNEILDTSIVFIKDSKEIWTHGNLYKSANWGFLENLEYSWDYELDTDFDILHVWLDFETDVLGHKDIEIKYVIINNVDGDPHECYYILDDAYIEDRTLHIHIGLQHSSSIADINTFFITVPFKTRGGWHTATIDC